MSTNNLNLVIVGGIVVALLIFLSYATRKGQSDAFPFTLSSSTPRRKRKGHRAGKKQKRNCLKISEDESMARTEVDKKEEPMNSYAVSKAKRPFPNSSVLTWALTLSNMENSRLERWWEESCERAELQENRAIDEQDGWKKVGRNGKVVKGRSVGRNAKFIDALEEQATESAAVEKDGDLGSTRKATAEKDKFTSTSRNQSLDSAFTSGLDDKDAAQSVSFTGNIVAVTEESLLTPPSTPTSSLQEEQEVTATLKASLAESNDGWQVVGPRRRGHRN